VRSKRLLRSRRRVRPRAALVAAAGWLALPRVQRRPARSKTTVDAGGRRNWPRAEGLPLQMDGIFYTSVKVSPRQRAVPQQRCCWTAISVCDSALPNGPRTAVPGSASQERKGRQRASVRPAMASGERYAGAAGSGSRRTAAQRVSQARRDGRPPPPPARALAPKRRTIGRHQDDARSDRRGAADSAGVEVELTLRSVSVCGCDSAPVAQAAWVLGLFTALLTITRKSDCLRAVGDGDRL
jgi:hypothetical protein